MYESDQTLKPLIISMKRSNGAYKGQIKKLKQELKKEQEINNNQAMQIAKIQKEWEETRVEKTNLQKQYDTLDTGYQSVCRKDQQLTSKGYAADNKISNLQITIDTMLKILKDGVI